MIGSHYQIVSMNSKQKKILNLGIFIPTCSNLWKVSILKTTEIILMCIEYKLFYSFIVLELVRYINGTPHQGTNRQYLPINR